MGSKMQHNSQSLCLRILTRSQSRRFLKNLERVDFWMPRSCLNHKCQPSLKQDGPNDAYGIWRGSKGRRRRSAGPRFNTHLDHPLNHPRNHPSNHPTKGFFCTGRKNPFPSKSPSQMLFNSEGPFGLSIEKGRKVVETGAFSNWVSRWIVQWIIQTSIEFGPW